MAREHLKMWSEFIDHTHLKPDGTEAQIRKLCEEALNFKCAAVCVLPVWAPLAKSLLQGSKTRLAAVLDFPLGGDLTQGRLASLENQLKSGVQEVDVVAPLGLVKSSHWNEVEKDILQLTQKTHAGGAQIKVIFETGLLTFEEITTLAKICVEAKVDFLKTSTGFGPRGANPEDIALFKTAIGSSRFSKIKASGGIRNFLDFKKYIEMGVERIGTSSAGAILNEAQPK
jgi:deoxyribose-phosphate aldolase